MTCWAFFCRYSILSTLVQGFSPDIYTDYQLSFTSGQHGAIAGRLSLHSGAGRIQHLHCCLCIVQDRLDAGMVCTFQDMQVVIASDVYSVQGIPRNLPIVPANICRSLHLVRMGKCVFCSRCGGCFFTKQVGVRNSHHSRQHLEHNLWSTHCSVGLYSRCL